MPRRFAIVQFPNLEMLAAMAAAGVARASSGETARAAQALSDVALLAWSYGELRNGANWFRRLLGVSGGTYTLGTLAGLSPTRSRA